jgi:two-component system, OmpR family, alkaline phosphatase synthesis response regulator PhoP
MAKDTILLIEDDDDIRELVVYNLERNGYRVKAAATGEQGLKEVAKRRPDLIILDLMLPDTDGLTICRRLRSDPALQDVPIAMLTARSEDADVVAGLELGADDYITKPFSPRVLVARVRALRRRGEAGKDGTSDLLQFGQLVIDPARHTVRIKDRSVDLTHTEFGVLQTLARRPGIVFSRYQIVDAVRGDDYPVTDRSVDVQVVGLRKKLGAYRRCIETVRGVGYRFRVPDSGHG